MEKVRNLIKDEYNRDTILNYIFRIIAMVLGVVTVSVNINYLGNTLYGLWVTIASIVSWMGSGDFGIANGLRNELAKAYAKDDKKREKELVSTAFFTLSKVAIILFLFMVIICEVFFKIGVLQTELRIPMYITAVFFCINLCLGICQSIAYSFQRSFLPSLCSCVATVLSIVIVVFLTIFKLEADLVVFAIIHGTAILISNILLLGILKRKIDFFKVIRKINYNSSLKKSILNTGLQFFGLQLCSLILLSTDNLLINYLMDSDMVTKYSIITKVYDVGFSLFSILFVPLWSAVTFYIQQNNFEWIIKKIKGTIKLWLIFVIGVVIVSMFFNYIVGIWLGENAFYYEIELRLLFAVYNICGAFSAIFINVMNGVGIVKLQLIVSVIGAIFNIPLSMFFAQNCCMGILGIKLATFLSMVPTFVIMPLQAYLYFKRMKAKP